MKRAGSVSATTFACCAVVFSICGCALPGIHREAAGGKAPAPDAGAGDAQTPMVVERGSQHNTDTEAPPDPRSDPANLNEDYATFRSLVPTQHVFAEWPMPDTSEHSKAKPSYTVSKHVVLDNVTKLRWQAKLPTIYPGCTGTYYFVDRPRGVGTGCTWEEAQAYCASPELAEQLGGGNWRVPTKIELESLIDVSRVNAVDPLFDDFPIDSVWTSSPYPNPIVDGLKMSWQVDFMEGMSTARARAKASRVRCVSSASETGGSTQAINFVDRVARESKTQLEWQRFPDGAPRTWRDAIKYCEELELNGGGWHLPSFKELLTIVDSTRHEPAINMRTLSVLPGQTYWSSSIYVNARNAVYLVEFDKGGTQFSDSFDDLRFARCVR